jgi:hypothetical protein
MSVLTRNEGLLADGEMETLLEPRHGHNKAGL